MYRLFALHQCFVGTSANNNPIIRNWEIKLRLIDGSGIGDQCKYGEKKDSTRTGSWVTDESRQSSLCFGFGCGESLPKRCRK